MSTCKQTHISSIFLYEAFCILFSFFVIICYFVISQIIPSGLAVSEPNLRHAFTADLFSVAKGLFTRQHPAVTFVATFLYQGLLPSSHQLEQRIWCSNAHLLVFSLASVVVIILEILGYHLEPELN